MLKNSLICEIPVYRLFTVTAQAVLFFSNKIKISNKNKPSVDFKLTKATIGFFGLFEINVPVVMKNNIRTDLMLVLTQGHSW